MLCLLILQLWKFTRPIREHGSSFAPGLPTSRPVPRIWSGCDGQLGFAVQRVSMEWVGERQMGAELAQAAAAKYRSRQEPSSTVAGFRFRNGLPQPGA
jgi:hypothetical protein